MTEASLSTGQPDKGANRGSSGRGPFGIAKLLKAVITQCTRPLVAAAGLMRVWRFRRDVIKHMRLTVTNLHPEVIIGGTDRRGCYAEIYLIFGDFRLRITRAIYNPGRQDLWADAGSKSEPAVFFRMDYVIAALGRLDKAGEIPELSECPNTLKALDATIWAVHRKLAEHFSAVKYGETKRMVQQVMHEEAALAATCAGFSGDESVRRRSSPTDTAASSL
jgi:hypothetical protein